MARGLRHRVRETVLKPLRRWLGKEAELNVRWHGIAGLELHLGAAELNAEEIGREALGSSPLVLQRATIRGLRFAFSLVGAPAMVLEVEGLQVEVSSRPVDDLYWSDVKMDSEEQERMKKLAAIDPEGSAEHARAEKLVKRGMFWEFFLRLLTGFLLSAIRIELRGVQMLYHCEQIQQHACISASHSIFPESPSNSYFKGSMLASSFDSIAAAFRKTPFSKRSSISDLCLRFERSGASTKPVAPGEHAVLLLMLLVSFNFCQGVFSNLSLDIPEAVVGLESREAEVLMTIVNELRGPDTIKERNVGAARTLEQVLPRERTPKELWTWAVAKILKSSPLRTLSRTLEAGLLRRRYATLYTRWLQEIGWRERRTSAPKADSLKKLSAALRQIEKQLPVEAVALARLVSRRQRMAALLAEPVDSKHQNGFKSALEKLRSFPSLLKTSEDGKDIPSGRRWVGKFSANFSRGSAIFLACDSTKCTRGVGVCLRWKRACASYGSASSTVGYSLVCGSLVGQLISVTVEGKREMNQSRPERKGRWDGRMLDHFTFFLGSGVQESEGVMGKYSTEVHAAYLAVKNEERRSWCNVSWMALDREEEAAEAPFLLAVYEETSAESVNEPSLISSLVLDVGKGDIILYGSIFRQALPLISQVEKYLDTKNSSTTDRRETKPSRLDVYYNEQVLKYFDSLRDLFFSAVPEKHLHVSVVVQSVELQLLESGISSNEVPNSFIFDFGYWNVMLWPPEEEGTASESPDGASSTVSRRWIRPPPSVVLPSVEGYLEHVQVGLNFVAYMNGVSVTRRKGDFLCQPIVEPFTFTVEASSCRDGFSSFFDSIKALSLSATVNVPSLVIDLRLDRMAALLESLISFEAELLKHFPKGASAPDQNEGERPRRINKCFAICFTATFEGLKAYIGGEESSENAAEDSYITLASAWLHSTFGDGLSSSICSGLQNLKFRLVSFDSTRSRRQVLVDELIGDHFIISLYDTSAGDDSSQHLACSLSQLDDFGKVREELYCSMDVDVGNVLVAGSCTDDLMAKARTYPSASENMRLQLALEKDTRKCIFDVEGGLLLLHTASVVRILTVIEKYSNGLRKLSTSRKNDHGSTDSLQQTRRSIPVERSYSLPDREQFSKNLVPFRSQSSPDDILKNVDEFLVEGILSMKVSGFSLIAATTGVLGRSMEGILMGFSGTCLVEMHLSSCKIRADISQFELVAFQDQRQQDSRDKRQRIPQFGPRASENNSTPEKDEIRGSSGANEACRLDFILDAFTSSLFLTKRAVLNPKWKTCWQGRASATGLHIALTTHEVQMVLSIVTPLSGLSSGSASAEAKEKRAYSEVERRSWFALPDGAIVAIKDTDEHLYLAVEDSVNEDRCHLGGVWHYSIAGEKALFQVKYQEGSKGENWFSLLSLHAKNSDGVPLRVHYRPGSRQVEISSTNDGSWELWQCKPCRSDSASEFDAYSGIFGNLVYLINQKSKQGIACVDGVPTFSRPGNPFKIQVVAQVDPSHQTGSDSSQKKLATTNLLSTSDAAAMPHVALDMGSVSITLLHEAAGVVHLLPLVRLRLEETQGLLQLSSYKMRTIASCNLVLEHYEAQSSSWLSIVNPVVTNLFWSSRSGPPADRHVKVPSSMFCRLKKVDVLVSELSLDACLFLIGVMDLAGPFTLHHSPVLVNRCQIENQTGLSLLCRFDRGTGGQEEGKVPSWQSKSYLMRHVTSRTGTTPAEVSTSVTINLEKPGKGFSSPVTLALGQPGVLAVRTRLEAFQDSRLNAPGPIVVIDISKQSQDGICLTVSPMVKIHNATGLALQLRCRRPKQSDEKGAIVSLKDGDIIDDAMGSFDALSLEGEMKKALLSFNVGNFLLSIRPESFAGEDKRPYEWSEDVKGAKAVRASGLFDKLNFSFKRTLKSKSLDFSFGSVFCKSSGNEDTDGLHFLIRTSRRQVAVTKISNEEQHKRSLVAWQEQQELLLLPTLRVSNFLSSAVHVQVATSTNDIKNSTSRANEVTISEKVGRASLYVDLTALFLVLKHADSGLVSDPVDISTGHKRYQELAKKGGNIKDLDMDINFKDGLYTALLKVYRADDGVLELSIFTKYAFVNDSEVPIICCPTKSASKWGTRRSRTLQWPSSVSTMSLPPNSFTSWLYKSNNLLLKRDEQGAQPAALDLESLSGSLEVSLGVQTVNSVDRIQLGVSLQVPYEVDSAPSHIVHMAPRYTVENDSTRQICVCQEGFEDDEQKHFTVAQGGKVAVHVQEQKESSDKSVSEGMDKQQTSALSLRFRIQESGWRWSGRVNAASLGSFFLKLQRDEDASRKQFAILSVEEKAASLAVRFRLRNGEPLPYRVENKLRSASVTFHQMGMTESETLMPGTSTDYVWDDLSMQHRLVITVAGTGTQACSDVNLDKIKAWRSFAAAHRKKGFSLQLPFQGQLGDNERDQPDDLLEKGYEVYADGQTRVLRICEKADSTKKSYWQSEMSLPRLKVELRIPIFRIFMIETGKQKIEDLTGEDLTGSSSAFMPFLCAVMTSVSTELLVTVEYTFCHFKIQGLGIDIKWAGAPFAAMLRLHDHDRLNKSSTALQAASVLANSSTNPIQVKYSSILLQAFDLNIDEDTLLKLVPFYRTSLSTSTTSRQIYFERFEIHPIKIVASFVPGNPRADYTSTQETFRALLHTVIKLPSVRGATVELNGVLLSHALLTFRQLVVKCVQHYSWYAMRAIYIARGSKLLPPGFASLFDDSAASSLDVFFDPSSGSIDLQGLTLGMFNLLSRGLRKKGQGGTSRYLGDLEKTVKKAGSNIMFAVVTELSDNILKGAEANGFEGMINGFRRGILNVAMQPLALQKAVVRGGPTRRIQLDRSVGTDEAYVEGYLQATLDAAFKQDYLKVKVMEDQLILKNLPPNSMLMNDIITCVRNFLIGEGLLAGEVSSSIGRSLRFLRGEQERKTVPAVISLSEQLLVIFAIRGLRQYTKNIFHIPSSLGKFSKSGASAADKEADGAASSSSQQPAPVERPNLKRAVGNFFISSAVAYIDGRLCRHIPNELARRIVSGFLLTFVE